MSIQNVYSGDRVRIYLLWPFYFLSSRFRYLNGTLGQIARATSNWWNVFLLYFGFAEKITLHYKSGLDFTATKDELGKAISLAEFENISDADRNRIRLRMLGKYATMRVGSKELKLEPEVAQAVAVELLSGEHSMINVKGRDVVDVGAYLDNTAIYYALSQKAKHVYAFEPYPYIFNTAVRSVKANKLGKMITTYNTAVSGVSGCAQLDKNLTSFGMVDAQKSGKQKGGIKVISLDSVVRSLGIKHGALKVDCEGCEYSIFSHSSGKTLRSFDIIHVEYHYGYVDIVERLRAEGFDVTYTKPAYNFRGFGSRAMLNGDIIATLHSG
jgi:FkbM family methyltransferase